MYIHMAVSPRRRVATKVEEVSVPYLFVLYNEEEE